MQRGIIKYQIMFLGGGHCEKSKKAAKIIFTAVIIWLGIFLVDYSIIINESRPVFCIETEKGCYSGIGYSFETYAHIVTCKTEYALYIFGRPVKSNFANEIAVQESEQAFT